MIQGLADMDAQMFYPAFIDTNAQNHVNIILSTKNFIHNHVPKCLNEIGNET